MDTPNPDEITLREAMELTGLSRAAFYKRIASGSLTPLPKPPAFKKRAVTKFKRADIEAMLKS